MNECCKELLEALKSILDSYEAHLALSESKPEDQWDEYDSEFVPKWRAARSAIKKATGE
jgi:Na+-transporting NADH:ubiquinone oxidoreductase subunit NqrF